MHRPQSSHVKSSMGLQVQPRDRLACVVLLLSFILALGIPHILVAFDLPWAAAGSSLLIVIGWGRLFPVSCIGGGSLAHSLMAMVLLSHSFAVIIAAVMRAVGG